MTGPSSDAELRRKWPEEQATFAFVDEDPEDAERELEEVEAQASRPEEWMKHASRYKSNRPSPTAARHRPVP